MYSIDSLNYKEGINNYFDIKSINNKTVNKKLFKFKRYTFKDNKLFESKLFHNRFKKLLSNSQKQYIISILNMCFQKVST